MVEILVDGVAAPAREGEPMAAFLIWHWNG